MRRKTFRGATHIDLSIHSVRTSIRRGLITGPHSRSPILTPRRVPGNPEKSIRRIRHAAFPLSAALCNDREDAYYSFRPGFCEVVDIIMHVPNRVKPFFKIFLENSGGMFGFQGFLIRQTAPRAFPSPSRTARGHPRVFGTSTASPALCDIPESQTGCP